MTLKTVLEFDSNIYDAEVIQKAAYRSINSIVVDIQVQQKSIICSCSPCNGISEENFWAAIEEFRKDVLDYNLRQKISAETVSVRNLILGIAFSKTGVSSE